MKRMYGLETELGATISKKGISAEEVICKTYNSLGLLQEGMLVSGGRAYIDLRHLELATAECPEARLTALHSVGMERWAQKNFRPEGIIFYANNVGLQKGKEITYGCHENLLIHKRLRKHNRLLGLVPYLVTRQIITGAGDVRKVKQKDEEKWKLVLSPRACFMEAVHNSFTTHTRGIINSKKENWMTKYSRLHLICGDSNMNWFQREFKLKSLAAVCEALEQNHSLEYKIINPVEAMRKLSFDAEQENGWIVSTKYGEEEKEKSAIQIQYDILNCVKRIRPMTGELEETIEEWEGILNDLEKDPMLLSKKLDWVTKKKVFERTCQKGKVDYSSARIRQLNINYHNISSEKKENRKGNLVHESPFYRLMEMGEIDRHFSEEEICYAMENPPSGRAKARARFIAHPDTNEVKWNSALVGEHRFYMQDPFSEYETEIDKFFAKIEREKRTSKIIL